MSAQDFNIAFVVWRESVEALLVVGILAAWIGARPQEERRRGRLWLWAGVAGGLVGACALAALLLTVGDSLGDDAQDYFQIAMAAAAAILIVQMVVWMRRHGRTLKRDLTGQLDSAAQEARWSAVAALAGVAVLREGAEAAVFLYGVAGGAGFVRAAIWAGVGFAAAGATYALLQAGARFFSWRAFFRVTEILLLLLAGALVLTAYDRLVSLGFLPELSGKLWDTSRILPDSGAFGGLLSSLFGYRARPVLGEIVTLGVYWLVVLWLLKRPLPRTA